MNQTPTADELMRQAPDTAALYLREAVNAIDAQFGTGYAAANPRLVAAFMASCTADFRACIMSNALRAVAEGLDGRLS